MTKLNTARLTGSQREDCSKETRKHAADTQPRTSSVNNEWRGACRACGHRQLERERERETRERRERWRRMEVGILNGAAEEKKKRNSFSPEESVLSSGRSLAPSQTSDCLWNNPTLIRQQQQQPPGNWALLHSLTGTSYREACCWLHVGTEHLLSLFIYTHILSSGMLEN